MKSIRMTAFGGPDVLTAHESTVPEPGPGQLRVRVESAAVNYADVMRRRNDPYPFPTPLPFTPGSEVAGTVDALGEGVAGPPVGTPVLALAGDDGSTGYAQFTLVRAAQAIPIPPGPGFDEAAGLIVAGSTAMLALTEVARLQPGETVVVEGAGGGVGGFAVQLAKLAGATVVASASTPDRRAAALAAGADEVVDPRDEGWPGRVRAVNGPGADVVLQVGGAATFGPALSALAPFGRLVVVGTASGVPVELDAAAARAVFHDPALNQSLHAFNLGLYFGLRPDVAGRALETFVGHVAAGRVKVTVGHVLPLARAAEAHELLEGRRSIGKIVLKPWVANHPRA